MATLEVHETFINETKGHHLGDSGWYEPYTEDLGALFRAMQREYGRCVSSMYIDIPGNVRPRKIGWVFQSRQQYEDTGRYGRPAEFYIREVWVEFRRGEFTGYEAA